MEFLRELCVFYESQNISSDSALMEKVYVLAGENDLPIDFYKEFFSSFSLEKVQMRTRKVHHCSMCFSVFIGFYFVKLGFV